MNITAAILPFLIKYKKQLGVGSMAVIVIFVVIMQRNEIGKLKNELAVSRVDSVFVDREHIQVVTDTIVLQPRRTVVSDTIWSRTPGDSILKIINTTVTDTIYEEKRGWVRFADSSNRLVSITGEVDYPYGNRVVLTYREKKFWDLQRPYSLFVGAGMLNNKLFLGLDASYKKVGLGLGYGDKQWVAMVRFRLK